MKSKPDGSLEFIDDINSDIDDRWAEIVSAISEVSLKHLSGQHNQKRHGYRYGGAPKPSQARELIRAGLWEDYLARARGGDRSIPSTKEFIAAQTFIRVSREKYSTALSDVDKEWDKYNRKTGTLTVLQKKRNELQEKYQALEHKRYKMEQDGYDKFSKRLDYLRSKKIAAEEKRDYAEYDRLDNEIGKVLERKGSFIASLTSTGEYYSHLQGATVKTKIHPIVGQTDRAHAAWIRMYQRAERAEKTGGTGDTSKARAAGEAAEKARQEYLNSTASARRVAMVYLRNDAMKLRKEFMALDRLEKDRNVGELEKRLNNIKEEAVASGVDYTSPFSKQYNEMYSIRARIDRIKSGDSASQRVKTQLQTAVMLSDADAVKVNTVYEKPVTDPSFRDSEMKNPGEHILSVRRHGVENFSLFVGKNSLVERSTINVKNGDYNLHKGRAYANENNIFMMADSRHWEIVHELGHVLEHLDPAILAEAMRFRSRRTGNEKSLKMADVTGHKGYADNEETKKDNFLDAYIGKDYADATEVMSMGLQMFYQGDIFRMANLDPDMFGFIYSVVRLGLD
jgi:hypothetical protein